MLAPVVREGLGRYGIGERARSLRLRKRMGLAELGRHTGLSPALLSKIENGQIFPTLPTLLRISMVFGVGLDHFFTDPKKKLVVEVIRKKQRRRFPERPDGKDISFDFESLDFMATDRKLNAYLAFFKEISAERARPHHHPGVEFVYVIRGRMVLRILDQDHALEAGDAIYFESHAPHSYRRRGRSPCEAMVVTTG